MKVNYDINDCKDDLFLNFFTNYIQTKYLHSILWYHEF